MRVINEDGITITEYDLSLGELTQAIVIKEDAVPPDNIEKFAWADDDYEEVQVYRPFYKDYTPVADVKAEKIAQMSAACNEVITSGIQMGDYHYSLNIEDQINMMSLQASVIAGEPYVPYHADGEDCRFYSAEEFLSISRVATHWKIYHESYFNSLRIYIQAMTTIREVEAVQYGISIPEEYQTDVLKQLLAQMEES